jgi:hypothetical protein
LLVINILTVISRFPFSFSSPPLYVSKERERAESERKKKREREKAIFEIVSLYHGHILVPFLSSLMTSDQTGSLSICS